MRPRQPNVQSMLSSWESVISTYFASTVPPKNSTPSSALWWTWMWSITVPLPTPCRAMPFSSFSSVNRMPANSTRT